MNGIKINCGKRVGREQPVKKTKDPKVKAIKDIIDNHDQVVKEFLISNTSAFVKLCLENIEQHNYFEKYDHLLTEEFFTNLISCPEIFDSDGDIEELIDHLPGLRIVDETFIHARKEISSIYLNPSKHAENYWKRLDSDAILTDKEIMLLKHNGSETALKYLEMYELRNV